VVSYEKYKKGDTLLAIEGTITPPLKYIILEHIDFTQIVIRST